MERLSGRVAILATLVGVIIALAVIAAGCGGDGDETTSGTTAAESPNDGVDDRADSAAEEPPGEERAPDSAGDERPPAPDDAIGERPGAGGNEDPGPPSRRPSSAQEQEIDAAVRAYLAALRSRDGRALCGQTFVPGALAQIDLPVRRGSCAATVRASIGHRPEPGAPRWLGASLVDSRTVILVRDGNGRLTATVANRLSGSNRSWIEDDVIYLTEAGGDGAAGQEGNWLIQKPSATFYRAVGYRDIPITALTPP